MPYLDLFVDFGVSGRVAGRGLGSRPADWPPALGGNFFEASWRPGHLVRQFGFVDAHFEDDSGEWPCRLIQITPSKVTRLPGMVPPPLAERYGEFPSRIPFEEVADALATAGAEVYHLARVHEAAMETYWVPAGQVMFWVISPYQADDFPALRPGDLNAVSIDATVTAPRVEWTRYR